MSAKWNRHDSTREILPTQIASWIEWCLFGWDTISEPIMLHFSIPYYEHAELQHVVQLLNVVPGYKLGFVPLCCNKLGFMNKNWVYVNWQIRSLSEAHLVPDFIKHLYALVHLLQRPVYLYLKLPVCPHDCLSAISTPCPLPPAKCTSALTVSVPFS